MCGSEITPRPIGLSAAASRLLKQAERVLASDDAPSPCVSVCRMSDDTPWCEGCWRTLDEIAAWSSMRSDEKRLVWYRLKQRLQAHA